MAIKRELIQFTIINSTDCDYNIPLFQQNVYSVNATTKYSWDVTAAVLSCGTGTIVVNSITYPLTFAANLSGLLSALNALGFGFFCTETIGGSTYIYVVDDTNVYGDLDLCPTGTSTTTTTTTGAPTTSTTTTTTTVPATSTTTSTTTAAPTTSTTTTTTTGTPTTSTTTTSTTNVGDTTTTTTTSTTTAPPTSTTTTTSTTTAPETSTTTTTSTTTAPPTSTTTTTSTTTAPETSTTTTTSTTTAPPTSTTTTSTTTSTTTLLANPLRVENILSLDISVTDVTVNGITATPLTGSYPIPAGENRDLTTTQFGTYTITVSFTNTITGQRITVTDSNNVSQCQTVNTSGTFTYTNCAVDGITQVLILCEDGVCTP